MNPKALYLCVNDSMLADCVADGAEGLLLDESMIADQHLKINAWGFSMSLDYSDRAIVDKKEKVFIESNFILLQRLFVQTLKVCLVLKQVIESKSIHTIHIYENNGSFFEMVCESYLNHFWPSTKVIKVPRAIKSAAGHRTGAKEWLVRALKGGVQAAEFRGITHSTHKDKRWLLVSGGLNHLSSILIELQKKHGYGIVYLENAFNWQQYIFCRKNGVRYVIIPPKSVALELTKDSPLSFEPGQVVYGGEDFSAVYHEVFKRYLRSGRATFPFDYEALSDFLSANQFDAILLDEDMAMRRMIGAMSGYKNYVVSHGIPGVPRDDADYDLRARYRSGITFASSEFEKTEYEKLYYDSNKILTTGIPRYDKLFQLKQSRPKRSTQKNILYCGASMKRIDFEGMYTVLGLKNYFGAYTERYLTDLLDILEPQKDVVLNIKPHYHEEHEWVRCLKAKPRDPSRVKLISHKANTFELERQAGLVITVESSVICESFMLDKPVVLLSYGNARLVSDYMRYPLVDLASSKDELKECIRRGLYDEAYLNDLSARRKKYFNYYCHPFDGKSTERVASVIARAAYV